MIERNIQQASFKHIIPNLNIGKLTISVGLLCLNQTYSCCFFFGVTRHNDVDYFVLPFAGAG